MQRNLRDAIRQRRLASGSWELVCADEHLHANWSTINLDTV